MNIPEKVLTKILTESNFPLFLIDCGSFPTDNNFNNILENEDLNTVLKLLKYKLILINKNKLNSYKIDIQKLCNRVPKNDFNLLHNILFYSLLIELDIDNIFKYLNQSCSFISSKQNIDTNLILHHLEIIDVVLEIFKLLNITETKEEFVLRDLILYLIVSDENNIRRKISEIIPGYISYTNNNNLFLKIWFEIQNLSNKYNIILSLEKYFVSETYNEKTFNILNEEQFWINLQNDICNSDVKKQAHYLLKKSIQTLFYNVSYRNYNPKFEILYWDKNNLEEYKNSWKNFFILCEVSNEKQIHLIEPTYKLYNFLKPLHSSWKNTISKLFIAHAHSAVVRLTILNILKCEWICDSNILVQGLNNNFLYENYENNEFNNYLNEYISKLNSDELTIFIYEICNNNSSPVPFYYLCKSISLCELKNIDLKIIINLINTTEKVPHLYIRKGIFHNLFICFIKVLKYNKEITYEFIEIMYLLHKNKYLQPNNASWLQLLEVLKNETYNILKLKFVNEYCLLPKDYSIFIILLKDLNIFEEDGFLNYLHYIFKQKNKLEYYNFWFNTINFTKTVLFNLSNDDINNIFNDLFNICNNCEYNDYSLDFFDNIEFILNSIIQSCTYEQCFKMHALFYEKLLFEKKYLCYFILIAQYVKFFEKENIKCEENLLIISENFQEFKINCFNELNNVLQKNAIKNKLLVNYYYTKLTIQKLFIQVSDNYEITNEIIEKLNKYYDKGGQNIIQIIDTLYVIISTCDFKNLSTNIIPEFLTLLHRCEKNIFTLRTSENYRPTITKFISILSHPQIFQHEILKEYVYNFFLSMFDSSQTITGIRNEILCQMHLEYMSPEILTEGLLFGQILRKDQRIEFETCNIISKDIEPLKFSLSNPCELDSKVRSKSVDILLFIMNDQNRSSNDRNNFCEIIYKQLIDNYKETAGKRYFGDSQIHVTKLRILQSLHLIMSKLNKIILYDTEEWLFNCLVNESQQPSIKILIQWLMIRIYSLLKIKDEYVQKLFQRIKNLKGTSYTSIFPIFYHMVKDKNINIYAVHDIITFLMPYTMGQQFSIRMSAQVTIKHIFELYSDEPDFSKKYYSIYKTVTDVINQTSSEKLNDNILTYYNLSLSIQTLYYDIPRLSNVTHTEWLATHLFTDNICMKLKSNDGLEMLKVNKKQLLASSTEIDNDNINVQKKIEVCNLENSNRNIVGNLIVVASLIDKVPNLGGLSRTCEVFGVSQYVLNNIQYMKNKEYQSLSMSSEKWIDTLEVKIENLSNYLIEMKKKNYRIIGAEQTSDSKKLDTYKFNKNTVLLLGNEKEGIPPNLIHLLDDCIEIPQFGQIRSLNVHVAGSLFIWEYIKQHYTNASCSNIS